jgi:hypothetical protein
MRDAWACWNTESQDWELQSVFDQGYCDDCEGEASLDEQPLEGDPSCAHAPVVPASTDTTTTTPEESS